MADITIRRAALPADQYVIITNAMARGKFPVRLHCGARCLLVHLLSLPIGWSTSRPQLNDSFAEGRDFVTNAIRELREAGYLRQDRHRGSAGRWSWTWRVTDDPLERPLSDGPADTPSTGEPTADQRVPRATEVPSMDRSSGTAAKQQVAPCAGAPSTVPQSISEDGSQKIDKKIDAPLRGVGAPDTADAMTVNQRAQRLARVYTNQVKLANFPAVMAVAKKAINTGDYTDEQIAAALERLAEDRRGVSTESLRIELEGPPAASERVHRTDAAIVRLIQGTGAPRYRPAVSTTDQRVRQAEALRDALVGASWEDIQGSPDALRPVVVEAAA